MSDEAKTFVTKHIVMNLKIEKCDECKAVMSFEENGECMACGHYQSEYDENFKKAKEEILKGEQK